MLRCFANIFPTEFPCMCRFCLYNASGRYGYMKISGGRAVCGFHMLKNKEYVPVDVFYTSFDVCERSACA